jgi:hypothetical protein
MPRGPICKRELFPARRRLTRPDFSGLDDVDSSVRFALPEQTLALAETADSRGLKQRALFASAEPVGYVGIALKVSVWVDQKLGRVQKLIMSGSPFQS